jgi:uncharacterized protein YggU (UPF0235/DUF167 family)
MDMLGFSRSQHDKKNKTAAKAAKPKKMSKEEIKAQKNQPAFDSVFVTKDKKGNQKMASDVGEKTTEVMSMKDGFLYVTVEVKAGGKSDQIDEINYHRGVVNVTVSAPPRKEKCNAAVCTLIAKVFNVKKTDVMI